MVEKSTQAKGGRRITGQGQRDMDLIAGRIQQKSSAADEEDEDDEEAQMWSYPRDCGGWIASQPASP